ncbi:MAG: hypothetical protein ABJF23_03135 [Bryobacteraceae bacterium]
MLTIRREHMSAFEQAAALGFEVRMLERLRKYFPRHDGATHSRLNAVWLLSGVDVHSSFVFLRNFAWSLQMNVVVDTGQPVGLRCTPKSSLPADGGMGIGKGGAIPNVDDPTPRTAGTSATSAAPGI